MSMGSSKETSACRVVPAETIHLVCDHFEHIINSFSAHACVHICVQAGHLSALQI